MIPLTAQGITDQAIAAELIRVIQACVEHHNRNPKPFIWTARASDIHAKVVKARARLNKLQSV